MHVLCPAVLVSRNLLEVTIAKVATPGEQGNELLDINVGTPSGVSNHLLIPICAGGHPSKPDPVQRPKSTPIIPTRLRSTGSSSFRDRPSSLFRQEIARKIADLDPAPHQVLHTLAAYPASNDHLRLVRKGERRQRVARLKQPLTQQPLQVL
jgi:hypothetical protein